MKLGLEWKDYLTGIWQVWIFFPWALLLLQMREIRCDEWHIPSLFLFIPTSDVTVSKLPPKLLLLTRHSANLRCIHNGVLVPERQSYWLQSFLWYKWALYDTAKYRTTTNRAVSNSFETKRSQSRKLMEMNDAGSGYITTIITLRYSAL